MNTKEDKMTRKRIILLPVLLLALTLGCAKNVNTTPQYQAAVANDRASVVLNVFCKQEINFKHSIDPALHKTIQQKCMQLATLDDQITNAIAANDFTSAKSYLNVATTLAQGLNADLLNIKDKTTQQTLQIAQTALIGALQAWSASLPNAPVKTGGTA
jgi:hypothetical protein